MTQPTLPDPAPLALEPGVARGATPGIALRGMIRLSADALSDDGDEPSAQARSEGWWANALASILGQLAVTSASTSQKILGDVCAVAASKGTLRGLESVLLSAVLGTPAATHEQATAAEAWSRYATVTDDQVVPVLAPRTRELVFLKGHEVSAATSAAGGLQVGLLDLMADSDALGKNAATDKRSNRAFANAVALAAGAVGAASPETSLTGPGASQALPDKLATGKALLVEVITSTPHPSATLAEDEAATSGSHTPIPTFPVLDDTSAPTHPFWNASFRCGTKVLADASLSTVTIERGQSYLLAALPDADADAHAAVDRSATPASNVPGLLTAQGTDQRAGSGSRRNRGYLPVAVATRAGRQAKLIETPMRRRIPTGFVVYVTYAPELDPITGLPSHYGFFPPGYAPPGGTPVPSGVPIPHQPGEFLRLIGEATRTLRLSTETPIGEVVEAINGSEYGVALNRATAAFRGFS